MLTPHAVAAAPAKATSSVELPGGEEAVLRPLTQRDEPQLRRFLDDLSSDTRARYDVVDASAHANDMCAGVAGERELRLVLVAPRSSVVLGLVEISLDLPIHTVLRYEAHAEPLSVGTDARYAICLTDDIQGAAIGRAVWSRVAELLRSFACRRVLLWGGVYETNQRARRHYERLGFRRAGRFTGAEGRSRLDMIVEL